MRPEKVNNLALQGLSWEHCMSYQCNKLPPDMVAYLNHTQGFLGQEFRKTFDGKLSPEIS